MNERLDSEKAPRKKKEIDFLDSVSRPIHLYADGRVGALEKRTVERTDVKRFEESGRELKRTVRVKQLAETAVYDSLADYVSADRKRVISRENSEEDEWKFAPDDKGWEAFEQWRDTSDVLDTDDIILRANELAEKSWQSNDDETVKCAHCPEETKYACYTTGWSREVYRNPLVRYVDDDGRHYDIPMNVANLVSARNRALQAPLDIKTTYSIGSDGSLSAEKYLSLNLTTLPRSYVAGKPMTGDVKIHPSEPLADGIHILIDTWVENGNKRAILQHRRGADNTDVTPDGILNQLQYRIIQEMYHERVESVDYDERLDELRQKVGKIGLELIYRMRYVGMGESNASFELTKPEHGYQPMARMSYSINAREGVDDALKYLSKRYGSIA